MNETNITNFVNALRAHDKSANEHRSADEKARNKILLSARKNGICRDTCFFGCISHLENFRSYCYLNKAFSECPCEEYVPRNTFSSLVRKLNPNKELVDDILSEWDMFDPWELKDLPPEKQKKLLNILELIYEEDEE